MGKTELYEFFDKKISMKAIEWVDYEFMVVGKTARISVDETGEIDIFICNHHDLKEGLGTSALRNRLKALQDPAARLVVELTGEGYIKTRVKDKIYQNLKLLGIKRKKVMSQESIDKMKAGLMEARNGNA